MSAALDVVRAALRGERAWAVGGAVRDAALGLDVCDLDIVIDGQPRNAAQAIARACRGPAFELSDAFGAWRVMAPDRAWQVDVVALHGDSIEDDLARRDFTINAIAEPLAGGDLLDPFGGIADLRARRLRMVTAEAFDADPLRVLRLVRFASVLGLEPESATLAAARQRSPAIKSVAGERVFAELRAVIAGDDVLGGIDLMGELALTEEILPELSVLRGVEQNRFHHLDVHDHTLEVLENVVALERDPVAAAGQELAAPVSEFLSRPFSDELTRATALRFGALFHDVAKPQTQAFHEDGSVLGFPGHSELGADMAREAFGRLRTSERLRSHVAALARHHLRPGFLVHQEQLDRRAIHRYLVATGDTAVDVVLLSIADRLATRGRNADESIEKHLTVARLLLAATLERDRDGEPDSLVRGDDLAADLGIEPGPVIGELLGEIAEARYAGEVATRAEAVEYARSLLAAGDG